MRFVLGVLVFFLLVMFLNALSTPEGVKLTGKWKLISDDGKVEMVEIPFYRTLDRSGVYVLIKEFQRCEGDSILFSSVSNHGMRIYLNGVLLKEIGDFRSGTANIWNFSHIVRFDEELMQDKNILRVEMKGVYDLGIHRTPQVVYYEKVGWRNVIFNFFINDIYLLAMGGSIVLGIVLLTFGLSVPGDHTHFVYIAIASLLSSVYMMEFIYRETTGNVDELLLFKKFTLAAGLTAIAFLVQGVGQFTGINKRITTMVFLLNFSGVIFFFLMPDLISFEKTQIISYILFITSTIFLTTIVFWHRKKHLIFPATFLSTTVVYTVVAIMSGFSGIYVVGYGVLVASLGFGMALIENYRDIYKKAEVTHRKSLIDHLTGAFNRSILREIPISSNDVVVMIDLDNFKEINDKYGHEAGDKALITMVEKMKENLRQDDIIVRYGGDEFLLVLKNCDELTATEIVQRIAAALENAPIELRYSYGIARVTEDLRTAIKVADERMYKMKKRN
ncbi:GGDEF domain-containing protein [Kosmotoga pacifica]|uniref:GGDEF domain-containing protein n=1 Tax=Kosmotoga pacifica TaxID=1330330 RepID=UPI000B1018FC|nr:GGDEF domain-containing protein [Kosmotoga pacifica]